MNVPTSTDPRAWVPHAGSAIVCLFALSEWKTRAREFVELSGWADVSNVAYRAVGDKPTLPGANEEPFVLSVWETECHEAVGQARRGRGETIVSVCGR